MIHYHGTPITPISALLRLGGSSFCVSFADPRDIRRCHEIGQSVMLDNGAYSFWRGDKKADWSKYYDWCNEWLIYNTTWAVIPDIIDGGSESENNQLVSRSPLKQSQSSPVWHLHEPLDRLGLLLDWGYERICFGSSQEYAVVGNPKWDGRVTKAFNYLSQRGPIPWIHMLRGMKMAGSHYPFSSVDSTDVARNHHLSDAKKMVDRWNAKQCPAIWVEQPTQQDFYDN
jgi:hypothetical protein